MKRNEVRLDEPYLGAWRDQDFAERFRRAFGKELIADGPRS